MNLKSFYQRFAGAADLLQAPLLFVIRLFWGWQFMLSGWGKLTHLEKTTQFFAGLHLPAPQVSAIAAGATECFGGVLLMLGLYSRGAALALAFTMSVAYATADKEALHALLNDPDKFTGATPFLFLFASLIILAFGPGVFSLDRFVFGSGSNSSSSKSAKPASSAKNRK